MKKTSHPFSISNHTANGFVVAIILGLGLLTATVAFNIQSGPSANGDPPTPSPTFVPYPYPIAIATPSNNSSPIPSTNTSPGGGPNPQQSNDGQIGTLIPPRIATLYLKPDSGDHPLTLSVDFKVDTGSDFAIANSIFITAHLDNLKYQNYSMAGSDFGQVAAAPTVRNGRLNFVVFNPGPGYAGPNGQIVKITFLAIKPGLAAITFDQAYSAVLAGTSGDFLRDVKNGTYNLHNPSTPTPTPTLSPGITPRPSYTFGATPPPTPIITHTLPPGTTPSPNPTPPPQSSSNTSNTTNSTSTTTNSTNNQSSTSSNQTVSVNPTNKSIFKTITVNVYATSAAITVETTNAVQAQVSWRSENELSYSQQLVDDSPSTHHQFILSNLEPETKYYYKLSTTTGNEEAEHAFRTLSLNTSVANNDTTNVGTTDGTDTTIVGDNTSGDNTGNTTDLIDQNSNLNGTNNTPGKSRSSWWIVIPIIGLLLLFLFLWWRRKRLNDELSYDDGDEYLPPEPETTLDTEIEPSDTPDTSSKEKETPINLFEAPSTPRQFSNPTTFKPVIKQTPPPIPAGPPPIEDSSRQITPSKIAIDENPINPPQDTFAPYSSPDTSIPPSTDQPPPDGTIPL